MTGLGPALAFAGYAGLLWVIALGLDAVGRRSLRRGPRAAPGERSVGSDVARFHSAIGGVALGVGSFLLLAHAIASRDASLLLLPLSVACLTGSVRRVAPLWREP